MGNLDSLNLEDRERAFKLWINRIFIIFALTVSSRKLNLYRNRDSVSKPESMEALDDFQTTLLKQKCTSLYNESFQALRHSTKGTL